MKELKIELSDNFESGFCPECPFTYGSFEDDRGDRVYLCSFNSVDFNKHGYICPVSEQDDGTYTLDLD